MAACCTSPGRWSVSSIRRFFTMSPGVYIPVIIPREMNKDGPSRDGAGDSPVAAMNTRTAPKKNIMNPEEPVPDVSRNPQSPSGLYPPTAKAGQGQDGNSGARAKRKRKVDYLLGRESVASSSGSGRAVRLVVQHQPTLLMLMLLCKQVFTARVTPWAVFTR